MCSTTALSRPASRPPSSAAYASRRAYEPARDAFAALTGDDPRAWAEHGRMTRLREELPDARTGLSRLEREILEALTPGPLAPHDLFLAVAAREQPPWLGGVHLVPGEPGWAWDAAAHEPVRG